MLNVSLWENEPTSHLSYELRRSCINYVPIQSITDDKTGSVRLHQQILLSSSPLSKYGHLCLPKNQDGDGHKTKVQTGLSLKLQSVLSSSVTAPSDTMASCQEFEVTVHTSPGPTCGTYNRLWLNLIGSQGETPPISVNEGDHHLLPGSVSFIRFYTNRTVRDELESVKLNKDHPE